MRTNLAGVPNQRTGRTRTTRWEVWTYDVWGNETDGYEVNDRCCVAREYEITENEELHPHNTRDATQGFFPVWDTPEDEIRAALDIRTDISVDIDGDGDTICVVESSTLYPLGELHRVEEDSNWGPSFNKREAV